MTLYQYRIVHLPFPPTHEGNENYLNVIGQQGWELVSACAFDHRVRVKTKIEHRVEQVCYFRKVFEPGDDLSPEFPPPIASNVPA